MASFSAISDEALVRQARLSNQQSLSALCERYYPRRFRYYYRSAPTFWLRLGEGECNAVFFSTILDCVGNFREGEVAFSVYFERSLRNNLLRSYRQAYPGGQIPLSLDQYFGDQEEGTCLADSVPAAPEEDPRISYSLLEQIERLAALKKTKLSVFDLRVCQMRLEGKSYRFIAERFHCSIKRVRVAHEHYQTFLRKNLL